jgi:two-component system, OmpR family, sensor histidine kinase ChvG
MNLAKLNPRRWSLGKKIASLVLIVLTIPIFSISLLKEIENTLVAGVTDNLALSNRLIANQLAVNAEWFEQSLLPDSKQFIGEEFIVFPISEQPMLDGHFDEWQESSAYRKYFSSGERAFSVLLGHSSNDLLVSIAVQDAFVIFPRFDGDGRSDSIEIEYKEHTDRYKGIYLSPTGPGEFAVKFKQANELKPDWRFKAYWLNTTTGFNIELRFPSGIKPQEIKITFNDVDEEKQGSYISRLPSTQHDLNPIIWPAPEFAEFLTKLSLRQAQRIWVLDKFGRVLASSGNLKVNDMRFSRNVVLNWILSNQTEIEKDPRESLLKLDSEVIFSAMNGKAKTAIEYLKGTSSAIAMAASPITISGEVKGVLLIEENVAKVQVLQKKALLKIFSLVLITFILVVWIVFWYVNRTVGRIKRLNQAIDEVVDEQGRMSSPLKLAVSDGDEIDELYTAFSNMGERLFDYNDYLEKLAARLSHELRTPIAIVRSSLDNLSLNCNDQEQLKIIQRAMDGNKRLGEIINRMRRASGVKQAMQSAQKESVEIVAMLTQVVNGFKASFPDYHFKFKSNVEVANLSISIDLFSEMLDKLLANAMDFSQSGQVIIVEVNSTQKNLEITVSNSGPLIASKNIKRIFDSLVSIRSEKQSTGTNLGLGLHIVRLISDYHGFSVSAHNREDGSGVIFRIIC